MNSRTRGLLYRLNENILKKLHSTSYNWTIRRESWISRMYSIAFCHRSSSLYRSKQSSDEINIAQSSIHKCPNYFAAVSLPLSYYARRYCISILKHFLNIIISSSDVRARLLQILSLLRMFPLPFLRKYSTYNSVD